MVSSGQPITAKDWNALRDCIAALWPRPSGDILPNMGSGGGTSYSLARRVPPVAVISPPVPAPNPPLYIYDASNDAGAKIGVTGGVLQHVYIGVLVAVAAYDPATVNDGDKVWVERTGPNDWLINKGADWPTDKLYLPLGDISVDDTGDVSVVDAITYNWDGGDLIVPEVFPVTVTGDSSDPPVYTVKTLAAAGGIDITADAAAGVPTNYRDADLSYIAGTTGFAKILADGSFAFFVEDEYADHETKCVAIVTGSDGTDSMGRPCYLIAPAQYSLTKLKSPTSCP